MNKIEALINRLCPNGVVHKNLGELIKIEKGKQLNKAHLFEKYEEGLYPVINGGIAPSGYWNEYNYNENLITISQGGASAGYVNYIETKFWAGAHCYVVTNVNDEIMYRYVYHFLKSKEVELQNSQVGAGIPSVSLKDINNLKIAVPSLEIQSEIVCLLDNFTLLSKKLSDELKARKQQYDYYRNFLLSVNGEEYKLGDIANLKTGSKPKEILESGEYEYINAGTTNSGYSSELNIEGNKVITPSRGEGGIGFVGYKKKDFWLGPLCYAIWSKDENVIITKYLYYELSSKKDEILKRKNTGGVPALNGCDLKTIPINVPTIEEQKRIINILDKFEKICEDTIEGLPAEIEARNKQYEFYRDLLLTFKELEVSEV